MKKVIWLCSWYPNAEDHFIGDFIQRHALAASAMAHIHVIHVRTSKQAYPSSFQEVNPRLSEEIHYVPKRAFSQFRYMRTYVSRIRAYIQKQGKPDGIHVQVPMTAGILALHAKWYLGIPFLVTEHYGIYNAHVVDHFGTRSFLYRIFTKLIVKQSKQLSTVSVALAEEMRLHGIEKNTTTIANVVDTSLFYYTAPPPSPFRFVHVSGMSALKNPEGILDAFESILQKNLSAQLIMVGDLQDHLLAKVAASSLLTNSVQFRGVCSYSEVAHELKQAHALVLFSDSESQSCVVLEALCSGRPCIVPATGGVKELIRAANGFQVPVRNTQALAESMQQMIAKYDQFDLQKIAQEAASRYAYEAIAQQIVANYDEYFG